MKDRVSQYPGRFRLTDLGGDLVELQPADQPLIEGTPLNKATFLKDATAALLQLAQTDPTVDDALNSLISLTNSKAKIQLGSYVGTGTYGASNPCNITCSFAPKIIALVGSSTSISWLGRDAYAQSNGNFTTLIAMDAITTGWKDGNGFGMYYASNRYGKKSADGKTFSWYITQDANMMFNGSGNTYYWLAIG